jgi:hypothetical protein
MAETTATDAIVDDARRAAAGTRTTARWLATALGGIPAIAILASIVRAPGDAGFDGWLLAAGIGLAAGGAVLALFSLVRVLSPISLEDADLARFNVKRLGISAENFPNFSQTVRQLRDAVARFESDAAARKAIAKSAEASAARREATAADLESRAKKHPSDTGLAERATKARLEADIAQRESAVAAGEAAAAGEVVTQWTTQLTRYDALLKDAYLLYAGDELERRFKSAQWWIALGLALIALGVFFLGMAPKAEDEDASTVSLVTLTLNEAGQEALDCNGTTTLSALRIGGEDDSPTVITFPTDECPAKTLDFTTTDPTPLGQVKTEQPIEPE